MCMECGERWAQHHLGALEALLFFVYSRNKIQEPNEAERLKYLVQQRFGGRVFLSDKNGESQTTAFPRSGGVATIIHGSCPGVGSASVVAPKTIPNRYLQVRLRWGDRTCYIHNIYTPNNAGARKTLFQRLPADFDEDAIHIVCGDFNLALDSEVDSIVSDRRPDSSVAPLRAWLTELNAVDAWRLHHPQDKVFSGPRPRRNRLDYIFVCDPLVSTCYEDSGYHTWDESDHKSHHVELTSWHHPTGPGFWRLQDWLLRIPDLRSDIRNEVQNLLSVLRLSDNSGIVWKSWQQRMKAYLKKCQKDLKLAAASEFAMARQQLEDCASAVAQDSVNDQAAVNLYFAKQRYEQSKEEWAEFRNQSSFELSVTESERSSSFFFRSPGYELRNTPFQSIRLTDGTVSTDPAAITLGFQRHWGKILADCSYAEEQAQPDQIAQRRLLDSIHRKLSAEARKTLDAELNSGEFAAAIRSMRSHSAPGPDGFTSAFYQIDPDLFGEILLIVFRYQLERGELLPHQRYSSVALLFKKGDRADPGNFRPITLIPVEVKALSRVLTDRLKPFMPTLVHPDQKGFIPGRSIHHQVILVRDIQHLVSCRGEKGIAAFLDFAKAYDRVDREYLFKIMERQGFGGYFLSWIRLLYKDSMCSLMINGWAQDALKPTRGVKQGDPLSPYLFALSLEPLGNLLRENRELGIAVDPSLSIPVAFFADDTVLFSQDVARLKEQLQIVECYCAGSGAKLNHSKSVIMSLNNRRSSPKLEPLRSLRKGDTVKYLGIPFGNADTSSMLAVQLEHKLMARLQLWKGRARTLMGRRLVVQAIILSLLWYFTTTTNIPVRFIKRWQSVVMRYILYNRVGAGSGINIVRKTFALQTQEKDGIGVPEIAVFIRRQHLTLLRQVVQALESRDSDPEVVWYRPIAELLRLRYGGYSRPWSGDFLLQDPPHPPGWRAAMLPIWWRKVICDWKKLIWPRRPQLRVTRTKELQYALFSPIWWSTMTEFQVGTESQRVPVGTGSVKFRRLCRELSAGQVWCLADFLDGSHRWPSSFDFFCKVSQLVEPQLKTQIELGDILLLYRQLTQVINRVLDDGGMSVATRETIPPIYGIPLENGTRYFPHLRKQDWKTMLQADNEVVTHPMTLLGCPTPLIHSMLSEWKWVRRCVIPVIHDVMLRLFFGDLIVGSRLYFLKSLNPTVQQCVRRSCVAIETLEHCFFSCPALDEMWQTLWQPWSQAFIAKLDWRLLLFPKPRDLKADWRWQQKEVLMLWRVHTAISFHSIWRLRNEIYFHATDADKPSTQSVKASFRRHCQFIFRHSAELGFEKRTVCVILWRLGLEEPCDQLIPPPSSQIWIPRQ